MVNHGVNFYPGLIAYCRSMVGYFGPRNMTNLLCEISNLDTLFSEGRGNTLRKKNKRTNETQYP